MPPGEPPSWPFSESQRRDVAGHVHRLWDDVSLGVGERSMWVGIGRGRMVPAAPSLVNLRRMAGLGWSWVGLGLMGHGPRLTASDDFWQIDDRITRE